MLASKVQDSDMHLKVENVVQLLRKFLDDNKASLVDMDETQKSLCSMGIEDQFGSRRLQNRALLEQVASQEKTTIRTLNFNLTIPTPAEFIVVYL